MDNIKKYTTSNRKGCRKFGTTDKQFLKEKSMPLTYTFEIQKRS